MAQQFFDHGKHGRGGHTRTKGSYRAKCLVCGKTRVVSLNAMFRVGALYCACGEILELSKRGKGRLGIGTEYPDKRRVCKKCKAKLRSQNTEDYCSPCLFQTKLGEQKLAEERRIKHEAECIKREKEQEREKKRRERKLRRDEKERQREEARQRSEWQRERDKEIRRREAEARAEIEDERRRRREAERVEIEKEREMEMIRNKKSSLEKYLDGILPHFGEGQTTDMKRKLCMAAFYLRKMRGAE